MKTTLNFGAHIILTLLIVTGCNSYKDYEFHKNQLMEADCNFSALSEEEGMNQAFMQYIAEDGVLLRPNKMPIVGREKIMEAFSKPDTNFSLSWEPLFADISKSGELGYTYGVYKVEMYAQDGSPVTINGTYVSVWKKDKKGEWKFVLDSGNQGIGK